MIILLCCTRTDNILTFQDNRTNVEPVSSNLKSNGGADGSKMNLKKINKHFIV